MANQPPVFIPPVPPMRSPPLVQGSPPPPTPVGLPLSPGLPYNIRDLAIPNMYCYANNSQTFAYCTYGNGTSAPEQYVPYNPADLASRVPIADGGQVRCAGGLQGLAEHPVVPALAPYAQLFWVLTARPLPLPLPHR
jgi:hypothetical protein